LESESGSRDLLPTVVVGACPLITNYNIEFMDSLPRTDPESQSRSQDHNACAAVRSLVDAAPSPTASITTPGQQQSARDQATGDPSDARRRLPAWTRRVARAASAAHGGVPMCESMALPHGPGRWEVAVNLNDPGMYSPEQVLEAVRLASTREAPSDPVLHRASTCHDDATMLGSQVPFVTLPTAASRSFAVPLRAYAIGLDEAQAATAIRELCMSSETGARGAGPDFNSDASTGGKDAPRAGDLLATDGDREAMGDIESACLLHTA